VLIETLFSIQGLGLLGFEAVMRRDYPVVMGSLFVFTLIGLFARLLTDLALVVLDPRIGFERNRP
jgi:microcin C transport system permease protein